MASRNMEQIAERASGRIPTEYDMTYKEMQRILSMDDLDAICTAFRLGFVMGHRATKAGKFKERKS